MNHLDYIAQEAGELWREEILYRYLLTKGDAFGGRMRNIIGKLASEKLQGAVSHALSRRNIPSAVSRTRSGKISMMQWHERALLFDWKPRLVRRKSIDAILVRTATDMDVTVLVESRERYLACGEVKGGIDPAGADEHWKTATSALSRIREAFGSAGCPALFFLGAAIEQDMAGEIFEQLGNGMLTHAANLNRDEQIDDLIEWLIEL
jgi:type II restriction enzyme